MTNKNSFLSNILIQLEESNKFIIGGNSLVFRVEYEGNSYAVKKFQSKNLDRGQREFKYTKLMNELFPENFAKVELFSSTERLIISRWISGLHPNKDTINLNKVCDNLRIFNKSFYTRGEQFKDNAVEAVFNSKDIVDQISNRISHFDKQNLIDAVKIQLETIKSLFANLNSTKLEFQSYSKVLSFSDFGFHNMICDNLTKKYVYIDLEFFGVDSAEKFLIDTLIHPQNDWTIDQKQFLLNYFYYIFGINQKFLDGLFPLLALKWYLIVLKRYQNTHNLNEIERGKLMNLMDKYRFLSTSDVSFYCTFEK